MKSSLSEIAKEAHRQGITYGEYVSKYDHDIKLQHIGVEPETTRKNDKRKCYTKINVKEADILYEKGMNDREIAKIFGVSHQAIYQWRKRTGRMVNTKRGQRQC